MNEWLKASGIRAIKTMAQTAIATIGCGYVISDVAWGYVASASFVAGVLSILTSLAGLPEVENKEIVDKATAIKVETDRAEELEDGV